MLKKNEKKGLLFAFLSAFLYDLNVPVSKYSLKTLSTNEILFLLYFGSAVGLFLLMLFNKKQKFSLKPPKGESIFIIGVIIFDILAALFIVESLKYIDASTVSLISILEISFTIIISHFIFKTKISKNLIIAVILVSVGGILLSFDSSTEFKLSIASMLTVFATACWGLENNLTAKVSDKNPLLLVFYKCFAVAIFNLLFILNINIFELFINNWSLLVIGFFTYGISILYYVYAINYIGISKTSIVFSFSPIFGALISLILFKEKITIYFVISLILMIMGIYFTIIDKKNIKKGNKL